jgi:hypothetical protein
MFLKTISIMHAWGNHLPQLIENLPFIDLLAVRWMKKRRLNYEIEEDGI